MKKKVKKTKGKRTRSGRQEVPTQEPSPTPSWIRPWILTTTEEYDERTVSAARYAEVLAQGRPFHGFTPRTEEEEEQYNLFLQQEYHQLGEADRQRAANYAEAERHQKMKAAEEAERRERIVAKAAKKKAKKEANARMTADRGKGSLGGG